MKEFNSYTPDIIDPDADNPYGTFVDEGGGEAGSPVLADFMNTVKALFEKVMSEAGITYDDAVDTVASCQSWDAFKSLFVDLVAAQTIAGIKTFSSIPVLPSSNPTSDNHAARKAYVDGLTDALQLLVDALESDKAENAITISASNGLTGGGNLTANRTVSGVNASTGAKGVVQLNDTRTSTSTSQAATANAVKLNKDDIDQNANNISTLDGEVAKVGEANTFTEEQTFDKIINTRDINGTYFQIVENDSGPGPYYIPQGNIFCFLFVFNSSATDETYVLQVKNPTGTQYIDIASVTFNLSDGWTVLYAGNISATNSNGLRVTRSGTGGLFSLLSYKV